ncbi:MAG: HEAT repeat domain-containing protein [Phycisphaerae bacterium]|nr:HEAT repeat domain-containing protein [Phycisphaerae bacterium]
MIAVLLVVGCSDHQKRTWKHRSAADNYRTALEAENADDRRDAVARIAESGYVASEDAFQVLDTAARTDPAFQIRCIAIRALATYKDARPLKTLLMILQATTEAEQALPPNDDVRWETVAAMLKLSRKGALAGQEPSLVRDILIKLAETDTSRNVRIAALEALGDFKDRQVLLPLVRSLRTQDFAIAERAEGSLIRLTGETHYADADAWEKWIASAEDPFANAGRVPPSTRPAGPTWFDRQKRAFKRAIKLAND